MSPSRVLVGIVLASTTLAHTSAGQITNSSPDNAALAAQVNELRTELRDLRNALASARNEPQPGSRNSSGWTEPSGGVAVAYPAQICAAGSYAVGIRAWGSPDTTRYCIGCLTGVAVLCKPFPPGIAQPQ